MGVRGSKALKDKRASWDPKGNMGSRVLKGNQARGFDRVLRGFSRVQEGEDKEQSRGLVSEDRECLSCFPRNPGLNYHLLGQATSPVIM